LDDIKLDGSRLMKRMRFMDDLDGFRWMKRMPLIENVLNINYVDSVQSFIIQETCYIIK